MAIYYRKTGWNPRTTSNSHIDSESILIELNHNPQLLQPSPPRHSTVEMYLAPNHSLTISAQVADLHGFMDSFKSFYYVDDVRKYVEESKNGSTNIPEVVGDLLTVVQEPHDASFTLNIGGINPNLEQLLFYFEHSNKTDDCYLEKLVDLLERGQCSKLKRISIWVLQGDYGKAKSLEPLCNVINTKLSRQLQWLDLNINNVSTGKLEINLSNVLPQLARFSLDFLVANWEDVLRQLGPELKIFRLNCFNIKEEQLGQVLQSTSWPGNVAVLGLSGIRDQNLVALACDHFISLQELIILNDSPNNLISLEMLLKIGNLTQLKRLRLIDFKVSVVAISEATRNSNHYMPRLAHLTLCAYDLIDYFAAHHCANGKFSGKTFCRTLAHQFPKVQYLTMVCYANGNEERIQSELAPYLRFFADFKGFLFNLKAKEYKFMSSNN